MDSCVRALSVIGPLPYGEFYKITVACLSVRQFGIFLKNESLAFSDFLQNSRWFEYLKTDRVLFSRKIHLCSNLDKNGPKIVFFYFLKLLVFSWKWSKMKTNVMNILPPIPHLAKFWFSSYGPKPCWPIKLQDSWKCNISSKKWVMKFIFGMQINIEVFLQVDSIIMDVDSQACSKYPN